MKKIGLVLKENIEQSIESQIKNSNNAFLMSYSNISASDFDTLRMELSKLGARIFVVKNSIAKRELKKRKLDKMADFIQGSTALISSIDEPVMVSKTIYKFAKDREGIKLRGGFLGEELIDEQKIRILTNLPAKDILQSMVLRAIQSPITGLVGVLSGSLRQLVYVVKQLSERKEGGQ
ncbi:MAG: 50S ribosomal protein L10 [Candidatus Omnitrophica bacterium]|nr:50S ribosomal protein L10 [Candidatus Omnitrophota bacterium]